jgi:uncharacterized protein
VKAPPRLVLDTNVVLSALVFGGGPTAQLRAGWMGGQFLPLASPATARELVRVLAYPKFKLTVAEQQNLLAGYFLYTHVVQIPEPPPATPRCRDAFDLPFLQLAIAGNADALISGDKDLLALAGTRGLCPVLRAAEFCHELKGRFAGRAVEPVSIEAMNQAIAAEASARHRRDKKH